MVLTILAAVFVFALLVLFHEFGHFITAKMTGMRVDEFAIGFGPKLASVQYGETLYSLRAIPLGGYNRIAGMDLDDDSAGERGYSARPIWARMIVILAGSVMNFILPLMIFFGIFFFAGIQTPSEEPVLGAVIEHRPAAQAGLQEGDRITRIDGREIATWQDFVDNIKDDGGKVLTVEFLRDGQPLATTLIPKYDEDAKRALVGVSGTVNVTELGLGQSAVFALQHTGEIIRRMLIGLFEIFTGQTAAELSGPLGVAEMAGQVAQMGFVPLLNFAALLSLNLGIINLLPVPALDGGHFVTLLLEAVRRKPLSKKAQQYSQMTGAVLLLALMIFATINDLMR